MKPADKKLLLSYLKKHTLMSIATFDKKPWIATVYYVFDNNLNLYFVSPPSSEHCQALENNDQVACSIADSGQIASSQKTGLQVRGKASKVSSWKKVKWMLKMFYRINPEAKEILNIENMKKRVVRSRVYKIKPTRFKLFSDALYKEKETKIFNP